MNDTNYINCPDSDCKMFWEPDCHCPCDGKCPHKDKMSISIVCGHCGEEVEVPWNHFMFCRVECSCHAWNFQRMSGKYELRRKDEQ